MSITKRRIELTIETERLLVVRRRSGGLALLCPYCPEPIPLVTADEAARQCAISSRLIYRWVESGLVHFLETRGEGLQICALSLLEQLAHHIPDGGPHET